MDEVPASRWKLDPASHTALQLERVRHALFDGAFEAAMVELEELLDAEPDHVDALRLLASCAVTLDDAFTAAEAWRKLARLDPSPSVRTQLALSELRSARFEVAEREARTSLELNGDQPEAWWILGRARELRGQPREAEAAFLRAWLDCPGLCPLPRRAPPGGWAAVIESALAVVAPSVRELWRSVPIRLEPAPTAERLSASVPPLPYDVLALADGDPIEQERPDALVVFTINLAHAGPAVEAAAALADALEDAAQPWAAVVEPDDGELID